MSLSKINISKVLILNFLILVCFSCSTRTNETQINKLLKPCAGDSTIFCGSLSVFENRDLQSGRKIELNIVVIPAYNKIISRAPIFYLEGGPGVAATNNTSFLTDTTYGYRKYHDIVLIDVRGTGGSNPLHCRQLQFKKDLKQQFEEMYPASAVKDCYDSLSKLADLTQYTTAHMARDMEEVRIWLGYKKINLWGLSYGTRLAQVFMKMFPGSVESCVLFSPTTTYSKMPLYHAQYAQESLDKLFEDCEKDSLCNITYPNLKNEFASLMKRGEEKTFTYKIPLADVKSQEIEIPWHAFHTKMRSLMYMPFGMRQVPFLIHEAYNNNWEPFISLFPNESSFDTGLAEGLYLCITCTEDVPFISQHEADSLVQDTYMKNYRIDQQKSACRNWINGSVPKDFFEPLHSEIPTLILSGPFDPVTPPFIAKKILETLTNGFLITIPQMSHLFDGLSNEACFDKIVVDFFANPTVKPQSECVNQMLPGPFKTKE